MIYQTPISNSSGLVMADSWVGENLQRSAILSIRMRADREVADCCIE